MQMVTENRAKSKHSREGRLKQISGNLDWFLDDMPDTLRFNNSVPLVQYMQKKKIVATANLLSDIEMPKDVDDSPKDETYYPHLKR